MSSQRRTTRPFKIDIAPDGLEVSWEPGDATAGEAFRNEALLRGLSSCRDMQNGTVIRRYRDVVETLELVVSSVREANGTPEISRAALALREERAAEEALLTSARRAPVRPRRLVAADMLEFASGRRLLDYQRTAVTRHIAIQNSADFSVPGAGKTSVALAYWAHLRRTVPDLRLWVVGPLSAFRPWEDEFAACFGRAPSSIRLRGSATARARILAHLAPFELVLCSYQTVWREQEAIQHALGERPYILVLDEAHYVKSPTGALSAAVRAVGPSAYRRLVLSGTPMPKGPEDLWSLFTFLWPSGRVLGSAQQYEARCRRPADDVVPELQRELGPLFHRTCKRELGLPDIETRYPIIAAEDVPPTQRLILRLVERRTVEEIDRLNKVDRRYLQQWRRARVVRLLQAASNPLLLADALDWQALALVDDDDPASVALAEERSLPLTQADSELATALRRFESLEEKSAKIAHVERRCRELVAAGNKVVIWTVFLGNVALLERVLRDLAPLSITGAIPAYDAADDEDAEDTREQRIEAFKHDPLRRVLIANMGACSESISLHRVCHHAIYLERSFNAAQFMQSLDRIHRQGMPSGTTAHVEIPSIPCAIERVLNSRLSTRQRRLYTLLNDPMSVVGFDGDAHRGFFDVDEVEDLDDLFEEVLRAIRQAADADPHPAPTRKRRGT